MRHNPLPQYEITCLLHTQSILHCCNQACYDKKLTYSCCLLTKQIVVQSPGHPPTHIPCCVTVCTALIKSNAPCHAHAYTCTQSISNTFEVCIHLYAHIYILHIKCFCVCACEIFKFRITEYQFVYLIILNRDNLMCSRKIYKIHATCNKSFTKNSILY